MKTVRIVVGVLAAVGAAYLAMLYVVFVGTPGHPSCTGTDIFEAPSPGAKYVVSVRGERCGLEQNSRTIAELSGGSIGAHTFVKIFEGPAVVTLGDTVAALNLQVRWRDDSHVELSYPQGVQQAPGEKTIDDVSIRYRELSNC